MNSNLPSDYSIFSNNLKIHILNSQIESHTSVNKELLVLYWEIGNEILIKQQKSGCGSKIVEQIAKDLREQFPSNKGFSRTNILYMRAFAEAYLLDQIVQQAVGQIPWGHNTVLLDKLKSVEERLWYANQCRENGWSRNILIIQIESNLYERAGKAITNFERTLPKPQSYLAVSLMKDPYNLDFLSLTAEAEEKELEEALVKHMRHFLLELGVGFAFMGNQYPIQVDKEEYRLDLLFYHTRLRCYIIIELKTGKFMPEYLGKMNFYVSAVDDLLRHKDDEHTIGIILCRSRSKTTVEYALRNVNTPISVSTHGLPAHLRDSLPTIEQLENEVEMVSKRVEEANN